MLLVSLEKVVAVLYFYNWKVVVVGAAVFEIDLVDAVEQEDQDSDHQTDGDLGQILLDEMPVNLEGEEQLNWGRSSS